MSQLSKALIAAASNAGGDFYPYTIENSCRMTGTGDYFSRSLSTSGNQKTWTLSFWVKKVATNLYGAFFGAGAGSGYNGTNVLNYGERIFYATYDNPSPPYYYVGFNELLRDTSAWYHIVVQLNTTHATTTERQKVWINGVRLSDYWYSNYIAQNTNGYVNSASYTHYIGYNPNYSGLHGYLADMIFLDGQALDPTSFAEDINGVWVPKDPAQQGFTFGTNGFWLDFSNSSALGTDASGNGNNWTSTGLTSSDQVIDTPTNNFCTVNPLDPEGASNTLSEGNLGVYINSQNTSEESGATFAFESGKWYWETYLLSTNSSNLSNVYVGVKDPNGSNYWMVRGNGGEAEHNGTQTNISGLSWGSVGDIVGVAVDADAGTWTVSVNGTWISGDVHTSLSGLLTPFNDNGNSANQHNIRVNFGQDSTFAGNTTAGSNTDANGNGEFKYAVPTDYLALCAANLTEPAIGPNSDTTSDENFNTVLYTGTGSSQSITGVGFQPDFLLISRRSANEYRWMVDVLRTLPTGFNPPATTERSDITDAVTSFDSDGFTAGGGSGYTGTSGNTYVAWNWKAGGSGVSNTDGSITSTVSANQDAGISIVRYAGTGASMTFGHGLGQPVDFMIIHRASDNFIAYPFSATGNLTNFLQMENLNPYASDSVCHTNNSTVIGLNASGARNTSGYNYMAYCFAEVEGFSSFGKYNGNGSTNGPFVYTGFRPAWVMIKKTNGYNDWGIWDAKRSPYNVVGRTLFFDSTNSEYSGNYLIDFLSNGFKLKNDVGISNDSGGQYIYVAFAEAPFKYSNAR